MDITCHLKVSDYLYVLVCYASTDVKKANQTWKVTVWVVNGDFMLWSHCSEQEDLRLFGDYEGRGHSRLGVFLLLLNWRSCSFSLFFFIVFLILLAELSFSDLL